MTLIIAPEMSETNFDETTRKSYIADPDVTAYNDYLEKIIKIFSEEDPGEGKVTVQEAASVIFDAVIGGSDTLRYVIGEDVKAMTDTRSFRSDQEYIGIVCERLNA